MSPVAHTSTHSGSHSVYTAIKIMLIVNHFQAIQPSSYVLIPNLALPRLQALITCSMQNWKCSKSGGGEWGSVSESYQSGNESVSESYQSRNESVSESCQSGNETVYLSRSYQSGNGPECLQSYQVAQDYTTMMCTISYRMCYANIQMLS